MPWSRVRAAVLYQLNHRVKADSRRLQNCHRNCHTHKPLFLKTVVERLQEGNEPFPLSEGLRFHAGKHISIFMRTTFDLPDDLMKRAKIAAVKRGSSLRDLVAEALSRLLAEPSALKRKRMTEAPIKLPPGHTIPIRSNSEIAQLFDQEDITHLNDVYSGR